MQQIILKNLQNQEIWERKNEKKLALVSVKELIKGNNRFSKNNNSKISAPIWDEEFGSNDGSHSLSVSDIQDYFECIIKKHKTLTYKPPIQTYVKKIKNRNTLKIKSEYQRKS